MTAVAQPSPFTERQRNQLVARRVELREQLRAAAEGAAHGGEHPPEVSDFKDVAAEETQATLNVFTAAHAAEELNQVAAALRRLDGGSYGLCQDCGEPIAEQRLLALPATPFCTACQARHERPGHR
ncbi:MAG TPA: TraR/DksA family transcriptional regulator [Ramlibacter sp.]|nr:TraR/DksA family transcriptional regulator [Ramlibacter sp.]